ncbi:hypothetical protein IWZ00DRAFT_500414 [Phyllosticta capitalensis]
MWMRLSRGNLCVISLLYPLNVAIRKCPVLVSQRDTSEGLWVHLVRRCANLKRRGVFVVESFDAKGKTSSMMCWRDLTRHQKVVLRRRPMDLGVEFGVPSSCSRSSALPLVNRTLLKIKPQSGTATVRTAPTMAMMDSVDNFGSSSKMECGIYDASKYQCLIQSRRG